MILGRSVIRRCWKLKGLSKVKGLGRKKGLRNNEGTTENERTRNNEEVLEMKATKTKPVSGATVKRGFGSGYDNGKERLEADCRMNRGLRVNYGV